MSLVDKASLAEKALGKYASRVEKYGITGATSIGVAQTGAIFGGTIGGIVGGARGGEDHTFLGGAAKGALIGGAIGAGVGGVAGKITKNFATEQGMNAKEFAEMFKGLGHDGIGL